MKQRVIKIGKYSLAVTIPVGFTRKVGIKAGDMVEVKKRTEKNEVIYKFSGIQQLLIASDILKKR